MRGSQPVRTLGVWKLMFLEFQANSGGYGDIIALGTNDSTQTMLSQVPYAFIIDRVYVHGDPVMGQKRGIHACEPGRAVQVLEFEVASEFEHHHSEKNKGRTMRPFGSTVKPSSTTSCRHGTSLWTVSQIM